MLILLNISKSLLRVTAYTCTCPDPFGFKLSSPTLACCSQQQGTTYDSIQLEVCSTWGFLRDFKSLTWRKRAVQWCVCGRYSDFSPMLPHEKSISSTGDLWQVKWWSIGKCQHSKLWSPIPEPFLSMAMLRIKGVYSYLHSSLPAITAPISTCIQEQKSSSQPVFHPRLRKIQWARNWCQRSLRCNAWDRFARVLQRSSICVHLRLPRAYLVGHWL